MKKIYFQKIFSYDPTFNKRYSKFEGYSHITKQRLSPSIINLDEKIMNKYSKIYSSNLKRAIQSAKLYCDHVEILSDLNEIKFDLKHLVTEEEYNLYGSNLVREKFIKFFIEDELLESRKSIKSRVEKVLKIISELPDGRYLFISHSFFMKILQIYMVHHDIFENPEKLRKYFDVNKKTFESGKGFYIM